MILMLTATVATGCLAFFGTARLERALQRAGAKADAAPSPRQLGVSAATVTAATVGSLLSPTLYALSSLGLVYLAVDFTGRRVRRLRGRRDATPALVSTALVWFFIVQGWFVLSAVGAFFYTASRQLIEEVEGVARDELLGLFDQASTTAWMRRGEVDLEVPTASLRAGDLIVVQAGEVLPAGGVVVEGSALIDQRILHREPEPVERGPGERVSALTVVLSGRVLVRVG